MNYRVVCFMLCAAFAMVGCGKKAPAPEAGAPDAPEVKSDAESAVAETADNQGGAAADKAEAKTAEAQTPQADAKPWPKRPDPLKDALCLKGNCKCGDGFCAKNAWCLKGECFCGYNPPWHVSYSAGSETYEADCYSFGSFLKSKDYGEFLCDWMDRSPHFACENSDGCKTRKGKSVNDGDFVTEGDGIKKISSMIDAPVLYDLCGIEASEKLRYDRSKFEAFANKLAMLREPEHCEGVTDTDPFALSCVRSAQAVDDLCEIRRNCDVWFVPAEERDRYVCEFDAGIHPDPTLGGAYYYSMPVGIRCDHEDGCACANARIAKGQYCNDGEGANKPKMRAVKLPEVEASDIIRPLIEHSFVEVYSGGLKWAEYEKTLEVPKLKLQKLIDGDALGKKLSDKDAEDYFRACRIKDTKKLSDGAEVSFITCESVDYKGDTDASCCEAGDSTACSGGFLALRASADDSYRVYPIGKLPEVCCSGDDCAEEYSYFLGDVYTSSFLDTKALHVTIGRNYHQNAQSEWPEDGMFCSEEMFGIRLEHYIFAGSKYRMVGKYPEYEMNKAVRHSGSEAYCGEFVRATERTGKLTLNDDSWTYVSDSGEIKLVLSDPEQLEENRKLGRKADEEDKSDVNFIVPDILPVYKRYIQYARRNYVFDATAMMEFYNPAPPRLEHGKLNADMKAFQGIHLKKRY